MAFIALGGIFIDAYDFTSLGIGVDTLQSQLSLTAFQVGSVTAVMALGALVGALAGGPRRVLPSVEGASAEVH